MPGAVNDGIKFVSFSWTLRNFEAERPCYSLGCKETKTDRAPVADINLGLCSSCKFKQISQPPHSMQRDLCVCACKIPQFNRMVFQQNSVVKYIERNSWKVTKCWKTSLFSVWLSYRNLSALSIWFSILNPWRLHQCKQKKKKIPLLVTLVICMRVSEVSNVFAKAKAKLLLCQRTVQKVNTFISIHRVLSISKSFFQIYF